MPVITVDGPKLSKEKKAEMVKEFSKTASKITGVPVDAFVVIIREVDAENVGVGDCLLCDLRRTEG